MKHHFKLNASLLAIAMLAMSGAHAADAGTMTKDQYKQSKAAIESTYKADKDACKSMTGNAKDVCREEAKAKEKTGKADLEASYSGKATDQTKAQKAHAEADYAVAKEKCDDQKGNDKDVCKQAAKTTETKALADINANQKVGKVENKAAADKNDADYKLAKEKCDSMSGDAKSQCVTAAKSQYGKS